MKKYLVFAIVCLLSCELKANSLEISQGADVSSSTVRTSHGPKVKKKRGRVIIIYDDKTITVEKDGSVKTECKKN